MSTSSLSGLCSSFHGSLTVSGEHRAALRKAFSSTVRTSKPLRLCPMMKNVNEGKGFFAPVVILTRNIIGKKRFNQLRGKAIALHSQVITEFCKTIGADGKQRQGLIRLAKKNGEKLGFLA
ncbi:protein PROTON GRADIENT REGULATION 5, chloroplastic [Phalaenopsis equestris]|uniref:protein PROTON GRADIENT REGULATION 5, chloroplastic n=1 Tax=Phalaenopsis equestris TaxID=78828 RepID=UPI0009E36AF2|nr:protein PROTON GRADIENT REGULATION 5, chloroplastic [Phalaenopsis equestris]